MQADTVNQQLVARASEDANRRTLLQIAREYCDAKVIFNGINPPQELIDFHTSTVRLLDEELKKDVPDPERTFTILYNLLMVLSGLADGKGTPSSFEPSVDNAMKLLREKHKLDAHSKTARDGNRLIHRLKNWKSKWVVFLPVSFLGVGSFIAALLSNYYRSQAGTEKKNFINAFASRVKSVVSNKQEPLSAHQILSDDYAHDSAVMLRLTVVFAFFLVLIVLLILAIKKLTRDTLKTENQFILLKKAFTDVAAQMEE